MAQIACGTNTATPDASATRHTTSILPADALYDARSDAHDAGADRTSISDAPPPVDHQVVGAANDSRPPVDGAPTPDATTLPIDATSPPPCPGTRNTLALTQSTLGGPLGNQLTATLTNVDSLWSTSTSPFTITATEGSGLSASLSLSSPSGTPLTPGIYPQGTALPDGGASVALSYAGNSCQATSGSVTVTTLTTDDAGVDSVLATFALSCATGPGATDEVTGCVRYSAKDPLDAGIPDARWDAGIADAGAEAGSLLAPCLGLPQAFFISGPPLATAPEEVTGANESWSAGENGIATLTVEATNRWVLALGAVEGNLIAPGMTYTNAGYLPENPPVPYFSLMANGVTCGDPNATFTVYAYADTGGDEAEITELVASFTTQCTVAGVTGVVTGCVSYEQQ